MASLPKWAIPAGVIGLLVTLSMCSGSKQQSGGNGSTIVLSADAVEQVKPSVEEAIKAEQEALEPSIREQMDASAIATTDQYLAELMATMNTAMVKADQVRIQSLFQDAERERNETGTPILEILERKLAYHENEAMRKVKEQGINAYGGNAEAIASYYPNLRDAYLLTQLIAAVKSGQMPVVAELRPQELWPRVDAYLVQAKRTRGLMSGEEVSNEQQ